MGSPALLFQKVLTGSAALLFGDDTDDLIFALDAVLDGPVPEIDALVGAVSMVGPSTGLPHRQSIAQGLQGRGTWGTPVPARTYSREPWQSVTPAINFYRAPWATANQAHPDGVDAPWRAGTRQYFNDRLPYQEAPRLSPMVSRLPWRGATEFDYIPSTQKWAKATPAPAPQARAPWVTATYSPRFVRSPWGQPARASGITRLPWRDGTRLSTHGGPALPPVVVPPPGVVPCYVPDGGSLIFFSPLTGLPALLFRCLGNLGLTIPQRSYYIVHNTVTVVRVVGSVPLIVTKLSLSLDHQSWTWRFSAQLPESQLALLTGRPLDLLVTINGQSIWVTVTDVRTDRQFPVKNVSISGMGRSAYLGAPYAPTLSLVNTAVRSAAQLMDDVLMFNGVPIGWSVNFGLTDWNVPAGSFVFRGTYIEGLQRIAKAAGGYLQPHPTIQQVVVLPEYPSAPWGWGSVTPDLTLPTGPVSSEGISYVDKPKYNRVFVSGESTGVLGDVTKSGSAGDLAAPMFVDQLIQTSVPVTQKGRAILSDTGSQAMVSLKFPVQAAWGGIIQPGKFVEYDDGSTTWFGLSRSVTIEASGGTENSPMAVVWQTITIEAHV